MPAFRVRVMPVSGAQQAWLQEMLQAAVHSIYSRDGSTPTSRLRCGGASALPSGSFSGQSPQNLEPPALMSRLRPAATSPDQMSATDALLASPRTRLP